MSLWRFRLQPASFRGVGFHVRSHDAEVGRRNAYHEYPLRDLPYAEDLGRRGRRFRVQALVLGDFYISRRDRLLQALEAGGPGQLVHPWLGRLNVAVESVRVVESSDAGGGAEFDIEFLETEANQYPSAEKSWASELVDWINTALATAENAFTAVWSVVEEGSQVLDAAATLVGGGAALLNGAMSTIHQTLTVATRWNAVAREIRALDDNALTLIQTPQELATQITGIVTGLGGACDWSNGRYSPARQQVQSTPAARPATAARRSEEDAEVAALVDTGQQSLARALQDIQSWPATLDTVPTTTAAREQEAANQAAFGRLLTQAALCEESRLSLARTFDSADAAQTYRDDLADRLDAAALAAEDDDLFESLTGLRIAVVRELTARAADLARIVSHTPPDTLPALALAWRLYTDCRLDRDLIRRNRPIIQHPGFVPGGIALEVLSE